MTTALAQCVDRLALPPQEGITPRAARAVLRMMAKIAQSSGEFKYGLRGSKLAFLTDYSLSVVRRVQRYGVDQGWIERVQVGGGRASTRWRICVDKIRADLESGHSSGDPATQDAGPPDTAQDRPPVFVPGMHLPAPRRKFWQAKQPAKPWERRPTAADRRSIDQEWCDVHEQPAGRNSDDSPKCPQCRYAHRLNP